MSTHAERRRATRERLEKEARIASWRRAILRAAVAHARESKAANELPRDRAGDIAAEIQAHDSEIERYVLEAEATDADEPFPLLDGEELYGEGGDDPW